MPSVPGDLFDFIAIRAALISRKEIVAVRFGVGLKQSLTPSRKSVPAINSSSIYMKNIGFLQLLAFKAAGTNPIPIPVCSPPKTLRISSTGERQPNQRGSSTMWKIEIADIYQIKTTNHLFQSIADDITLGREGVGGCLILDVVYAVKIAYQHEGQSSSYCIGRDGLTEKVVSLSFYVTT
ncbi:hypothetical protein OUZ56_033343 [Daphnia magna]|uniref:Uncharacterized protein n=1 Tax=Daphnia magna TaxID=35525 RepID=A0ABQ9ZXN0_9CRUS|nr:hypothetical protein OUZ56_033343 [Daphnia magna]